MEILSKFNGPFKLLGRYFEDGESKSKKGSLMVIGLQTLIQISEGKSNYVVIKSAMKKSLHHLPPTTSTLESCYLKSCFLCTKNLSLDKDIYMYRGDQGFCSIECRNRQIVLDEMKEAEASSKKIHKSYNYRYCSSAGRRETRLLLEDLRRKNKPVTQQNHWAIVS